MVNQSYFAVLRATRLLAFLMGAAATLWALPAGALEPVADVEADNHAELGQPFAHVVKVAGDVAAISMDSSESRHLRQGDLVKVGDHLQSSPGGEALLLELDGGMLALRPSSELWVETFAAEGMASDHAGLRLVVGGVRSIPGWIARLNQPGELIVTPSASIGIRGTDHESYVLEAEMAKASQERAGSYDRVSSGASVLSAGNQNLLVDAGQVGFVGASRPATRGGMTLVLPVLLGRVPAFYTGGTFDADMDAYAPKAEQDSERMLKQRLGQAVNPSDDASCNPSRVGKQWLKRLDAAQLRRDSASIAQLFVNGAVFSSTMRGDAGEVTTVEVERDQFLTQTLAANKGGRSSHLQRRPGEFSASIEHSSEGCADVVVVSGLMERGALQGMSHDMETVEHYVLERRQGKWVAVRASTGAVQALP